MERDDIIKALECCSSEITSEFNCDACPYRSKGCNASLLRDALSLIKEPAEVAERREGAEESPVDSSTPSVTELQRENERLNQIITQLGKNNDEIARVYPLAIKEAKADTVRKMHSLCKERAVIMVNTQDEQAVVVDVEDIDQIAKEMLEDKNERPN